MGKLDRVKAVGGIILALQGIPANPSLDGTTRDLAKHYGRYAKEVRAPETRRDIERTIAAATRHKAASQKNSSMVTKKNIKRLK
jgi:hypothetical protein